MTISKSRYFIRQKDGDQQAVVLYTDGTTEIWDRDGSKIKTSGGDRFDDYCGEMLGESYLDDATPGWQAPEDP